MTPAEKLRELEEAPGVSRYYRLNVYPGYSNAQVYLLYVPGSDSRPLTKREALEYVAACQAREAMKEASGAGL